MMMPTMGNKMIHKVNTTLLIGSKSSNVAKNSW